MRIGIDARPLCSQRTGIGNYVYGLMKHMPQVAPNNDYFLYANREIESNAFGASVKEQIDRAFGWCPGSFWLRGRGGSLARRDRLDVFWATYPLLPARVPHGVFK